MKTKDFGIELKEEEYTLFDELNFYRNGLERLSNGDYKVIIDNFSFCENNNSLKAFLRCFFESRIAEIEEEITDTSDKINKNN